MACSDLCRNSESIRYGNRSCKSRRREREENILPNMEKHKAKCGEC